MNNIIIIILVNTCNVLLSRKCHHLYEWSEGEKIHSKFTSAQKIHHITNLNRKTLLLLLIKYFHIAIISNDIDIIMMIIITLFKCTTFGYVIYEFGH